MTQVGEKFGVSGTYMARICAMLRVPKPARGYWAKLAVGKAPAATPLPDPQPGDPLGWSRSGEPIPRAALALEAPPPGTRRRRVSKVTGIHPLIRGAKEHFESGRPVDEHDYLRPYKKLLVDIHASKTGLDKALLFANDLFNALESAGHRVTFPSNGAHRGEIDRYEQPRKQQPGYPTLWSPWNSTAVYIGTLPVALSVVEMSESVRMRYVNGKYIRDSDHVPPRRQYVDHTWTTTRDIPCGRLRLIAHSPHWRVNWSLMWQETRNRPLTSRIRSIVRELEAAAPELVEAMNEVRRKEESEHQERLAARERERLAEDRQKTRESVEKSLAQLRQIIQAWADVTNLERFFQGVAERADTLDGTERERVLTRLQLAREMVGTQDPLDFFLAWKAPLERYRPLAMRREDQADDDESGSDL